MAKVLVVEDDSALNELVCLVLEEAGYDVLSAVDGMAGFASVVQDRPAVVISDINMPRMDGLTFCKAVKNEPQYRSIPFIMMTARDGRCIGPTACSYDALFKKPFDFDELLDTVDQLTTVN